MASSPTGILLAKDLLCAENNGGQHGHPAQHDANAPKHFTKAHNTLSFW